MSIPTVLQYLAFNRLIVYFHWQMVQGSPDVRTAFIPDKNCPYKRDVLTSMHFTITNPRLVLCGSSKCFPFIQICSYKHGPYMRASLYCRSWKFLHLWQFVELFLLQNLLLFGKKLSSQNGNFT